MILSFSHFTHFHSVFSSVILTFEVDFPLVVVVVFLAVRNRLGAVLADGDLDALRGEALAQRRALNDARELLGRVDLEDVAVRARQHWRRARVEPVPVADIDEVQLQPASTATEKPSPPFSPSDGVSERERRKEKRK